MRELGGIVLGQMRDALTKRSHTELAEGQAEPPVVAQLMIEIRSDGSRTIARGALNDLRSNESATIHAEGRTPADLMMSLASSLLALPTTLFASARRKPDVLDKNASPSPKPARTDGADGADDKD